LLGSVKTLGEAGAEKITVFRATGVLGLCTIENSETPAIKLLQKLQAYKNGKIYLSTSSNKLRCSSLFLEEEKQCYCFLANHTNEIAQVKIPKRKEIIVLKAFEIIVVVLGENRFS